MQSPHQVDMKNIVKWWKYFLLYFTTLETYCVKGSYLWKGLNLAAKVNRNLSRTLIIDVWLKDTLWASEWTYVARDVSICVGWFVYLLMSLLYVLAKSFCITPARVAFYFQFLIASILPDQIFIFRIESMRKMNIWSGRMLAIKNWKFMNLN